MGALVERRITRQLDCAEREGSCLVPRTEADGAALRYRGLALVCPLRGMFVRRRTWRRLRPPERMRCHFERVLSAFALPRRAESDLWPPAPQYVTTSVEVLEVSRWTLLASNVRAA